MLRTLKGDHGEVEYSKLVFDDLYKNSYEKEKLSNDEKFFYFKTLYRIKNKLRQQQNNLFGDVFNHHIEAKRVPMPLEVKRPEASPINHTGYSIQKINNRLFKINRAPPNTDRRSRSGERGRPQSQNLSFRAELTNEMEVNVRSRLEDIVNRHRSLQRKYHLKKQEHTLEVLPKSLRGLDQRRTIHAHR